MPRQFGQGQGDAAVASGEGLRVLQCPVRHQQALDLCIHQVSRGELDRIAGANQQHRRLVKPRKNLARQSHGSKSDGHRVCPYPRVGAHALGHRKSLLEQSVERIAQAARITRGLPCFLYLAQDLWLAQDHRIQAGGHAKQVSNRIGVVMPVQIAFKRRGLQSMVPGKPDGHRRFPAVLDLGVDFSAIAGR